MKEKIEQLGKLKVEITSELKEWVKDKSIPLDERWDTFFKSGLGRHISSIETFVNLTGNDICSVFQPSRHETIHLGDIAEYGISSIESEEAYNEFREDVLNKFVKSFEWDW